MKKKKIIGDLGRYYAHPNPYKNLESKRYFLSIIDGRKGSHKILATIWGDNALKCYINTTTIVELLNSALLII